MEPFVRQVLLSDNRKANANGDSRETGSCMVVEERPEVIIVRSARPFEPTERN